MHCWPASWLQLSAAPVGSPADPPTLPLLLLPLPPLPRCCCADNAAAWRQRRRPAVAVGRGPAAAGGAALGVLRQASCHQRCCLLLGSAGQPRLDAVSRRLLGCPISHPGTNRCLSTNTSSPCPALPCACHHCCWCSLRAGVRPARWRGVSAGGECAGGAQQGQCHDG